MQEVSKAITTKHRIEEFIIEALGKPRTNIIESPLICLDGLHTEQDAKYLLQLADCLKQLVGRRIRGVVWENRLDFETNPDGTLGRFVIVLEP